MKCYELTEVEINGHHNLCNLASEAGYPSLRSCLNDLGWWEEDVEWVEQELKEQIKMGPQE